jgi:hypothetical protein
VDDCTKRRKSDQDERKMMPVARLLGGVVFLYDKLVRYCDLDL